MSEANDYVLGEMDVTSQKAMFSGFLKTTAWASLILIMAIGYATFTLTMGVNWLVALVGFALVGIVGGASMGLGGAWIATVIGLSVLAVFIQVLVMLGSALV